MSIAGGREVVKGRGAAADTARVTEKTHFAATSGAADAHIPPTAVRVLIVEDNAADAEYVAELLELTEHGDVEVRVATTLADALEQLVEMPDCALLDLGLPDTAGLEGVLELSRHAPGLPIVVLSGQSDRAIAMQAVKHGAQDYLNKGAIDGDNVLRAIRYAIERKRTEHTLSVWPRRTSSPAWRTVRSSSSTSREPSIGGAARSRWPCCSSISTGSRRSTTAWDMPPAICCSRR
jgi:DNA-binding NarL/FixJ family response regulator